VIFAAFALEAPGNGCAEGAAGRGGRKRESGEDRGNLTDNNNNRSRPPTAGCSN